MNLGPKGAARSTKEPLKCWEFGEPHLQRTFPHLNETNKNIHNIQEASKGRETKRSIHRIHAFLEDR